MTMSEPHSNYKWRPLTDLSEADQAAASDELPVLAKTWREQRDDLDARQVEEFNERLQREWAIETGIIEHVYTLDRGTTQILIERGIDAAFIGHDNTNQAPELVAAIIGDQKAAVEWLFDVIRQRQLVSVSFIKQLHALMTRRQVWVHGLDQFGNSTKTKLRHGEYKAEPNNPKRPDGSVHEYSPPLQVASEMERLVSLHNKHVVEGVAPEVEATWLHHRFTQIHPFQDGNGRVARALASLELIRAGWFPLVVTRDDRVRYIDALEGADQGDLAPLVQLFVTIEKRAFRRALGLAEQVRQEAERLDQMIDAIGAMFSRRDEVARVELDKAKELAHRLWIFTDQRLEGVKDELEGRIGNGKVQRKVAVQRAQDDDSDRRHWHRYQVVQAASALDYFANIAEFHEWVRLNFITEAGRAELLVSFHGLGQDYRGVIGVSACFYRRQVADDSESQIVELEAVTDEVFQVTYNDEAAAVERRFKLWLEAALLQGLDQWRRGE